MNELSLFSGAGGGLLGTMLLGFRPIGYVEWDDYCQRVIAARIKDGYLPNAPIFGDIRTFISEGYAASYTGMVDVVTGGFPCQPFSVAGKQKGADDERNMWPATADVIGIVRPRFVLLENVPGIRKYLPVVVRDLRRLGYEVSRPLILGADDVGAPHRRKRVWIFAHDADARAEGLRREWENSVLQAAHAEEVRRGEGDQDTGRPREGTATAGERGGSSDGFGDEHPENHAAINDLSSPHSPQRQDDGRDGRSMDGAETIREGFNAAVGVGDSDTSDTDSERQQEQWGGESIRTEHGESQCSSWAEEWPEVATRLCRVDDGVAHRVDRLKALGNGQVPAVVRAAWGMLGGL